MNKTFGKTFLERGRGGGWEEGKGEKKEGGKVYWGGERHQACLISECLNFWEPAFFISIF